MYLRLGCILLELVKRARTEGVRAHHGGLKPLLLEVVGVLGARGGLASTCGWTQRALLSAVYLSRSIRSTD